MYRKSTLRKMTPEARALGEMVNQADALSRALKRKVKLQDNYGADVKGLLQELVQARATNAKLVAENDRLRALLNGTKGGNDGQ